MDLEDFANVKWTTPLVFRKVCRSEELPLDEELGSSGMFTIGDTQLAVFRFPDNRLFASQNMCGHRRAFVLGSGSLDRNKSGEASVTCPVHHRKFALEGPNAGHTPRASFRHTIATFQCHEEDGDIYVSLPDIDELDEVLGSAIWSLNSNNNSNPVRTAATAWLRDEPDKTHQCKVLDPQLTW